MAKRKLYRFGVDVGVCEEAKFNDEHHHDYGALFHPRMDKISPMAGYAPYWLCGSGLDEYEEVKEYKV